MDIDKKYREAMLFQYRADKFFNKNFFIKFINSLFNNNLDLEINNNFNLYKGSAANFMLINKYNDAIQVYLKILKLTDKYKDILYESDINSIHYNLYICYKQLHDIKTIYYLKKIVLYYENIHDFHNSIKYMELIIQEYEINEPNRNNIDLYLNIFNYGINYGKYKFLFNKIYSICNTLIKNNQYENAYILYDNLYQNNNISSINGIYKYDDYLLKYFLCYIILNLNNYNLIKKFYDNIINGIMTNRYDNFMYELLNLIKFKNSNYNFNEEKYNLDSIDLILFRNINFKITGIEEDDLIL